MEIPILTLNRENKETVLRYHPQKQMDGIVMLLTSLVRVTHGSNVEATMAKVRAGECLTSALKMVVVTTYYLPVL